MPEYLKCIVKNNIMYSNNDQKIDKKKLQIFTVYIIRNTTIARRKKINR